MPESSKTVLIRKWKRPVGTGLSSAYLLAEDEHGWWFHTPARSRHDDWDEFEDAHASGLISGDEAQAAQAATTELEPFGDVGVRYFDEAIALDLPALVDVPTATEISPR